MDDKVVMTDKHLEFFQSNGLCKEGTVEDAQKLFDGMSNKNQKEFLSAFARPQAPASEQQAPGSAEPPAPAPPESGKARTAEERDGEPAKQYKVKRHVSHNEKLFKIGEVMSEELFTPEQIDALIATGTIEEVKEDE